MKLGQQTPHHRRRRRRSQQTSGDRIEGRERDNDESLQLNNCIYSLLQGEEDILILLEVLQPPAQPEVVISALMADLAGTKPRMSHAVTAEHVIET